MLPVQPFSFGKYTSPSGRVIGRGTSSQVVLGETLAAPSTPVAFKVFHVNLRTQKSAEIDVLKREIEVMKHLQHVNVLKLVDEGVVRVFLSYSSGMKRTCVAVCFKIPIS